MAIAHSEVQPFQAPGSVDRTTALLRFYGAVCTIPSVRRIGVFPTSPILDFWVQLGEDNEDDERRIYLALHELDALRLGPSVDLHVVFAGEPEHAFPRDAAVVFERS